MRVVAERRRGESTAGDGQRGRRDSSEEHGESWFQWSFAPASARASVKGNQVGLQRTRGTPRRHEGDADDAEWRDERWTEGRDEGDGGRERGKEGKAAAVERRRERERVWDRVPVELCSRQS